MSYVIQDGGITGQTVKSIGADVQMWPSGSAGTTMLPTTSWIEGDVQYSKGANQLILWPIFTYGPATTGCKVKVEFSYTAVGPWFQEPSYTEAIDATKTYLATTRILPSGVNTPIAIPFIGDYIRISALVTGAASGSLLGITGTIASAL
jgi:hypothetical protein